MKQSNALVEKIFAAADAMNDEMVTRRRDLHKYAEPGWTEFRTAAMVAGELTKLGYAVEAGAAVVKKEAMMGVPSDERLAKEMERAVSEGADPQWVEKMAGGLTGVVGTMKCAGDGPVVALRFDMDALDLRETTDAGHEPLEKGFASVHDWGMHACGHDGHTTIGLAVAKILAELKEELKGTVKMIFQPAEEGVRGAYAMVEAGVVDDADYLLGAHIGMKLPRTGAIAARIYGMLATTKFDANFTGVPAHAGMAPEQGKNALLAAACAALNLHAISRHSGGTSRINVGKLIAGSGRNVIGDKALLQLETRGISTEVNEYVAAEAQRIIKAAADMYGVTVDISRAGGAAGAENSPALADALTEHARELGIFSEIVEEPVDFGGSEDCSYFMQRVQNNGGQAAYLNIGAKLAAGHHDAHFTFDEAVLGLSVKVIATSAAGLLNGEIKA